MANTIYTLTSRRFPCSVTCEILRPIPGTPCYVVDAHIDGGISVYAHANELTDYGPDDSCDGWDKDR